MKQAEKNLLASLRKRGYKLTPQRRAVIEVIASPGDFHTPASIYERVHRVHPDIGLVTIYRTLELLSELGLICELHTSSRQRSYTASIPQHHHHLICTSCGTVVNFAGRHLEQLEMSLSRESGFRIDTHLLEFTGLCRACQEAT